jgi:hypothetical protein
VLSACERLCSSDFLLSQCCGSRFDESRLPQLGYEAKGELYGFVKPSSDYGENY